MDGKSQTTLKEAALRGARAHYVTEALPLPAGYGQLSAEDRASMFIDWCALHGFGTDGWPQGAYEQLVAHIRHSEHRFALKEQS